MPENQQSEWKSTWQDRHLEWVCAFANANGGVLEVGKNDQGEVIGLQDSGFKPPQRGADEMKSNETGHGSTTDGH
jgi:predicted HTH transcriptional regulator